MANIKKHLTTECSECTIRGITSIPENHVIKMVKQWYLYQRTFNWFRDSDNLEILLQCRSTFPCHSLHISFNINWVSQPLMSSSITSEMRWQKPCQEDLKQITTRPRSMSSTTVSMPGLPPCHAQSSCPQDWKTRRGQLSSSYPPSVCRRARVVSARGSTGHLDIWQSQGAGP